LALSSTITEVGKTLASNTPEVTAEDKPDRSNRMLALSPFMRYFALEGKATDTGKGASLAGKERRGLKNNPGALPLSPSTISTQALPVPSGHQEKPLGAPGEGLSTVAERVAVDK
jgi:hypothetical protein